MVQQYPASEGSTSGRTDNLRSADFATIEYEHGPFHKYPQENKRAAHFLSIFTMPSLHALERWRKPKTTNCSARCLILCTYTANNATKDILVSARVIDTSISRVESIAPQDRKLFPPWLLLALLGGPEGFNK